MKIMCFPKFNLQPFAPFLIIILTEVKEGQARFFNFDPFLKSL